MNKYIHEYIQAAYMLAYIHAITHTEDEEKTIEHDGLSQRPAAYRFGICF